MNILYTKEQFNQAKLHHKLQLKCGYCNNSFLRKKCQILDNIKNKTNPFCCRQCYYNSMKTKITCKCKHCNTIIIKNPFEINKYKNIFCSQKCKGKYYSQFNKAFRRSKLEKWLETQLIKTFPDLPIHFNDRKTIKQLELDIYIPLLRLAFEINGPCHYEPIFGTDNFKKIQDRDKQKLIECYKNDIELCIINTRQQRNFTEKTSQKYFKIIKTLIGTNIKRGASGKT